MRDTPTRSAFSVPVVILEAGKVGIRSALNDPEVVLLAGKLGMRARSKAPLVVLEAGRFGMSLSVIAASVGGAMLVRKFAPL